MSLKPPKKSDLGKSWMKNRRDKARMIQPEYHLIASEGTETEPQYFGAIQRIINSKYRDRIQLKVEGIGDNTVNLLMKARQYVQNNGIVFKHVWIVYDTDDFPAENINMVAQLCEEYNAQGETIYHAVWSNQCVELWYLLHFMYGVTFVHYSGECVSTQTGEKATVGIYFKLNDDSSFEIDRMTMNGETLNLIMQNVALSEISDSYCKDHGLASSNALEGSLDELENALNDALADSSSSVSVAEPESETYTEDADSDNSAQTATRSDRKVVSTNGMDTYSELSGEISVDVSHYEIGEMPENVKEYYLSYGSDFDTAWLNALYTDVYEYSGKYSNQVAWERFTEYMVFYDEVVDYNNELAPAPALYDVYYAYDPATEEEAALCVDDVIQIAEENGAEIQIW